VAPGVARAAHHRRAETRGVAMTNDANRHDESAARLRELGIGGHVRLTAHARERGIGRGYDRGVIVGWGRHKWIVRVRPNGRTTPGSYHVDFWEPSPDQEIGSAP